MKKTLTIVLLMMFSFTAFSQEILGYKVDGKLVKTRKEARVFITELEKLKDDMDYEIQSEMCVVYGEEEDDSLDEKLEEFMKEAGFTMEIEGIYGDDTHSFEVYDNNDEYIGGFSAYVCD